MTELVLRAEMAIRAAHAASDAAGKHRLLVALDGRCASGKTTLAAALSAALSDIGCTVLHMDDFFLRPEQRTPSRLSTPGENIDHERFLSEVLRPLAEGEMPIYRPFSCRTQTVGDAVDLALAPIVLIEGSYACHPRLRDRYDLRLFLSVDPKTQMDRILARNGDAAAIAFRDRWIPLEEAYIAACAPQTVCLCLS